MIKINGCIKIKFMGKVDGIYTNEEKKLLILEFADKERQKFERLG